jgi:hypothetical protein
MENQVIEDNIRTGRVDEALADIKRSLNGYLRSYDRIYIGATSDAENRWAAHEQNDWDKMVLLYETEWAGSCRSMEKKLIAHARGTKFRVDPENVLAGGEGIYDGHDAYWVYVLVESW